MRTKAVVFGALLVAGAPLASTAATSYVWYEAYSPASFPTLYVHTGGSVDIQLEHGDVLQSEAIIGDARWVMTSVTADNTPHIIVKASTALPDAQLLVIPTSRHEYHVLLRSGAGETSTYTVVFFDRAPKSLPTPAPTPRAVTIKSCAPPLDTRYRVSGDPRIRVDAVCDDGVRTYILMRAVAPAAVPYRVDPGGHQDQILNPGFEPMPAGANGPAVGQWVLDGVYDHLALVADSSRGQIRVNIDRIGAVARADADPAATPQPRGADARGADGP